MTRRACLSIVLPRSAAGTPFLPPKGEKNMKKLCAWLLTLVLAVTCLGSAFAQEETTVWKVLKELLQGRRLTLTVHAEGDCELAEKLAALGNIVCVASQTEQEIHLDVSCDADTYLKATVTENGLQLDTNLLDGQALSCDWEALAPKVSVMTADNGAQTVKVSMTGPDQELINFSCKATAAEAAYQVEVTGGFITGPGSVYSLWDSMSAEADGASREFAFTYDENELLLEASGQSSVTDEAGCTVLTRVDDFTVYLNEDEMGRLMLHSEWRVEEKP